MRRILAEVAAVALCLGLLIPPLAVADEGEGEGEGEWRTLASDRRIVVEARTDADGTPRVRGRIRFAHSLADTATALLALEDFGRWVPGLREWNVLERADDHALVYGRHDLPWPLADRDYVVRYSWSRDPDRFVLEAMSDAEAGERSTPVAGVVRLGSVHTRWEVRAIDDAHCRVEYTFAGDIAARRLPNFILRYAWIDDVREAFAGLEAEAARANADSMRPQGRVAPEGPSPRNTSGAPPK